MRLPEFHRKQGPGQRFEALLGPHIDHLYTLAYRFCGHRQEAEDLVQDLLIKLYPRLEELEKLQRLRPWLARVLYNLFIDGVRSRQRNPVALAGNQPAEIIDTRADPGLGPMRATDHDQFLQRVERALETLSDEQRVLVSLHDIEGYSLSELEAILSTPIGTLKSRLSRSRAKLRAALEREPFAADERVKGQRR